MSVFGIDPASKSLAIAAVGTPMVSWKLTTTCDQRWEQLIDLKSQFYNVLDSLRPEAIFLEEPVVAGARNIRSTIQVAETVGMVLGIGLPVYLVPVSTWKKATVGKGNAKKEDVAVWINESNPAYAALCGKDQDLMDAGAIATYGAQVMETHRRPRL